MEYFERIKKISNAWEPELCRHFVDRDERVCMDIYHTGALAPERHKMTMERGSAVQMEDAERMMRYLDGKDLHPGYVDLRVEGKAYYK